MEIAAARAEGGLHAARAGQADGRAGRRRPSSTARCGCCPAERYQTADEMLADVERVLRTEFHSAGQTELKLWLEQLARRDDAPTIGKRRVDTSGVVKDKIETDLSAGTSFELDDVDKGAGTAPTELSSPRHEAGRPPPMPEGGWIDGAGGGRRGGRGAAPGSGWASSSRSPRSSASATPRTGRSRRASSARWGWAAMPARTRRAGRRRRPATTPAPPAPAPTRPGAAGADGRRADAGAHAAGAGAVTAAGRTPRPRPRRRAPVAQAAPDARAPSSPTTSGRRQDRRPDAGRRQEGRRRRRPGRGGAAARRGPQRRGGRDRRGGGGATAAAKPGAKKAAPRRAGASAGRKPKTAAAEDRRERQAGARPAKVETAVLHITSAPRGAIVRTKESRPRPHADQPALQDRQHLRAEAGQARLQARDPQGGRQQHQGSQDRRDAGEEEARRRRSDRSSARTDDAGRASRCDARVGRAARRAVAPPRGGAAGPSAPAVPGASRADAASPRAAAVAAFARARARAASAGGRPRDHAAVDRAADRGRRRCARRSVTVPERDQAFVRANLETARGYADRGRGGRRSLSRRDRDDGEGVPRRLGRDAAAVRALRAARLQARAPGRVAAGRRAARRVLRSPAQPAPRVRPRQPPARERRGGVAQRAAAARRARAGRVAVRARRADGLRRPGRRRRHARDRGRAARLRRRSRSDHADRAVDGRRRHVADRPAPPGAVRGAGARLRGRRLPPDGPARGRADLRSRRARARCRRRRWPTTPRACRSSSFTAPRTRPCPSPIRARWSSGSASSAGWARTSATPSTRTSTTARGCPAYKDAALLRTLAAIKRDPAAPEAPPRRRRRVRRRSRACSARASRGRRRTSTSTARTARPTRSRPARALANALADWGPMVGAKLRGQGRRRGDRRRSRAVLAGAGRGGAAQRAGRSRCATPDARPLGDRAFRAWPRDPAQPGPLHVGAGRADAARLSTA